MSDVVNDAGTQRPTFVSRAPKLGFVSGFDGVRGASVIIVMLAHIFPEGTDSFTPIVDVFFVISAFLIVTLLLQERRDRGTIDLKRFYKRRAVRLLPNSYACMAAWMIIWALVKATGLTLPDDGLEQVNAIPGNVLAAATYTYHIFFPVGGNPGPLVQFWSLSLEEQFYIFIGFAVVWMVATGRRVGVACALMFAVIVWISVARWNVNLGPWPGSEYSLDWWSRGLRLLWMARPDSLLVGVLLAYGNALIRDPLSPRVRRVIIAAGTIGTITAALVLVSSLEILHKRGFGFWVPGIPRDARQVINRDGQMWCSLDVDKPFRPCTEELWVFRWGFNAMALSIAAITLCLARCRDSLVSRLFSWKWLRKVGEMSYSLYLWHILAYLLVIPLTGGMGSGPTAVLKLAAAFGVGYLAHRFIDRRVLDRRVKFPTEYPNGGSGATK